MQAIYPLKSVRRALAVTLTLSLIASQMLWHETASAQDTVTGAFEGTVTDSVDGQPVADADVQIILPEKNLVIRKRTDARGRFYQGLLEPGIYTIRVSAQGFQTREVIQRLFVTRTGEVVPVPVTLDLVPTGATTTTTAASSTTPSTVSSGRTLSAAETDVRARTSGGDASRGGSFTEEEVTSLPVGSTTFVRSFDQLALLLPGVAAAPQTLGGVPGPGVGAGVGTSGQFAVNGLRSRANNFTVDGSDNNDEDIGVRRQGFFALNSQPVESVREYQVITLLAPASFGRNFGAQVNAVSKSGTNEYHGTVYGFFNSSQLNNRNAFDSRRANGSTPLTVNSQSVIFAPGFTFDNATLNFRAVNGAPLQTVFNSGDKDSLTYANGGFTFSAPVVKDQAFYFISYERQQLNAAQEQNFAVPSVQERGAFGTGATGIFRDPFTTQATFANPTTRGGANIFSLYPFPNNPEGNYGANTFTQTLPSSAAGNVFSAKFDNNFRWRERLQSFTARYNFTQDFRIIPAVGGALFSTLKPRVRTQNISLFYNSELSRSEAAHPLFNQLRFSYGRTRLDFDEVRDGDYMLPSEHAMPFLLNAPAIGNITLPNVINNQITPNRNDILYTPLRDARGSASTVERELGAIGQIKIAGFSSIGADVFNFPQHRVNNTFQLADELTYRFKQHRFTLGIDTRRTELNSDLPRNFRPLITFNGAPEIALNANNGLSFTNDFVRPVDLAAAGAASGFFQTIAAGNDAAIGLRFYQLNFYAHDDFRVLPNLSLSFGLRYEYNTPPRETNNQVESSFADAAVNLVPGLNRFIDNRTRIFEPDRNNFAPRVAVAYAPTLSLLNRNRSATVVRAGYGLFYDQILGAVVSQSRSVFPRFVTVNLAGGLGNTLFPLLPLNLANPATNPQLVNAGTLNLRSTLLTLPEQINLINQLASANGALPSASGIEVTLPARELKSPRAHHYTFSVEHQLTSDLNLSVAYVGTSGENLLRFATPNLGSNAVLLPFRFNVAFEGETSNVFVPNFFGIAVPPGTRPAPANSTNPDGSSRLFTGGRPEPTVGGVSIFETTAASRYDALQVQLRGRFSRRLQFQIAYTLSKTIDDVSDVFELAGASELPQNSLAPNERGFANFDARHRFAYNVIYDLPRSDNKLLDTLFKNFQIASIGRYASGQPFTVNSIFDVNLDGNLTDRLNTTNGIVQTGNRRQPLRLEGNVNPTSLLAPIGQDGAVGRNVFRSGNTLELDVAFTKTINFTERHRVQLRTEIFNFTNRTNYGIPVRFLEAPGFGNAINTVTPARRVQFALKYLF